MSQRILLESARHNRAPDLALPCALKRHTPHQVWKSHLDVTRAKKWQADSLVNDNAVLRSKTWCWMLASCLSEEEPCFVAH